jgi:hypothetical protein
MGKPKPVVRPEKLDELIRNAGISDDAAKQLREANTPTDTPTTRSPRSGGHGAPAPESPTGLNVSVFS